MSPFLKTVKDLFVLPDGHIPSPSPFLNGEAIKLIFDHLRNITLCTLIGQVGLVARNLGGTSEVAQAVARGYGYAFLTLAVCFFMLNLLHGEHLLRWSPHFESLRNSKWYSLIEKTYWFVYATLAFPACFVSLVKSAA